MWLKFVWFAYGLRNKNVNVSVRCGERQRQRWQQSIDGGAQCGNTESKGMGGESVWRNIYSMHNAILMVCRHLFRVKWAIESCILGIFASKNLRAHREQQGGLCTSLSLSFCRNRKQQLKLIKNNLKERSWQNYVCVSVSWMMEAIMREMVKMASVLWRST